MLNYYDILEVHQEVSTEELKRSFRILIKKYHPDIHRHNKQWAERKTKTIIHAYKTLSDSITRERYDRLFNSHVQNNETQRTVKKDITTDEGESVKTHVRSVFIDLLDGQIHNAIEKYEHLLKNHSSNDFLIHLNHRDYFDCKFLLAEAYEKLGQCEIANEFYEFILEKNRQDTYRRHLLSEIKERIRNNYCRNLARRSTPEKALAYYGKALKLRLDRNDNAFIFKKIAECYLKLEEYETAVKHLNIALSLKPNLQGISKLKTKLNHLIPNFSI